MEWNEKQRKTAAGSILIGVAAIAITTVVMAAGMGGGPGGGGPGGPGGGNMQMTEKSASIITVKLENPTIGKMERQTEFIGKIEAADTISIYPETNGKIVKLHYDEGDYIKAGDLLMELDTSDLQFALERAEASYASSVASYESSIASANKTLGSDYTSKILNAENSLEKAEQSYRQARLNYKSEIDSEDDNIDSLMERKDKAETAMDELLDEYNHMKGSASQEDLEAKYEEYLKARSDYNNYAEQYSEALDDYDDYKSSVATSKNNAYKDLVKAQQEMELATGDAYQEQKAVTEAQLKSSKLSLESSLLSLESAQRDLDKTKVFTPVSGKITACNVEPYRMANSNTAAFVIKNDDSVQLTFNASSDGAAALNIGDNITVSRGSETYQATITEIETEADASSGLFPIKADLEEGCNLLPGVSVKVAATTAKAENSLMVPIDHVYYDGDQPYVFVYSDGKAHRADLKTGMSNETEIVVEDGITSSSLIITTWHPDLADNVDVLLAEGMQQLVESAASAPSIKPAASASSNPKSETAKETKIKNSEKELEDKSLQEESEEERSEILYDSMEEEEDPDFGIELPEEPTYPEEPKTKDLSPAYVGNSNAASNAIAKSIIEKSSSGSGLLNKKN